MTHMMLIPVSGEPRMVEVTGGYESMGETIGCEYLERVRVAPDWAMVVDEMGGYTDKPVNAIASDLYGAAIHGEVVVGDVLLAREGWVDDGPDSGIDFLDTTEEQAMGFLAEREVFVGPQEGS